MRPNSGVEAVGMQRIVEPHTDLRIHKADASLGVGKLGGNIAQVHMLALDVGEIVAHVAGQGVHRKRTEVERDIELSLAANSLRSASIDCYGASGDSDFTLEVYIWPVE